jgi:gliding motility-associated-like protein
MTTGTGYTVSASNGNCNSPVSSSFSNAAQLTTPATPTIASTAATCSATGSSTITNYNATLTYSFTPAGPSAGAGGVITGMTTGTGYTVSASNGNCNSPASGSFSNAAQLTTPAAPALSVTQPTCATQTGSITVTSGSGLTYSIDGINYQAGNTFSALNPGSYNITVKNTGGCISAAANATLTLPACATDDLYVPNTFTPNGDGKNDIFLVKGTTIKNMQLLIFNQWGEKVFEANKQDQGWDGRAGGKPQPVGVYVYVLKTELLSGKIKNLKGSITLIR